MNYKVIVKQIFYFFISSGIGFVIDFTVYYSLVSKLELRVLYANMLSALPAITFVFIISNTKIFNVEKTNFLNKFKKYLLYLCYQFLLLMVVSYIGDYLYFNHTLFLREMFDIIKIKLLIKVLITPITMTLNFIAMKILVERIR